MPPTSAEVAPLTLDAVASAKLIGVSRSHFYDLHLEGRVPAPIRLGRAVRWSRAELVEWLAAGGPPRAEWEKMRRGARA